MTTATLRTLVSDDVDWIYEACQDREIQKWTTVPRPYERSHAVDFVAGASEELDRWAIVPTNSNVPVGVIGVHGIVDGEASIGYWMVPQYRNRGFTVAALHLVFEEIEVWRTRGTIAVDSVIASIAVDNLASRSAVERAGFEMSRITHGPAVLDLEMVPTCVYVKVL